MVNMSERIVRCNHYHVGRFGTIEYISQGRCRRERYAYCIQYRYAPTRSRSRFNPLHGAIDSVFVICKEFNIA